MRRLFGSVLVLCACTVAGEPNWRGLVVEDEHRCAPYDRGEYRYPPTVEDGIIATLGDIYSPYTCTRFASKHETVIEHMIALSEAHDSGLCRADRKTKREFATELRNLTLATPALNSSKSARDAAEWLPERNRCWFAARIVEVRKTYGLTIDQQEADALESVLARCPAPGLDVPYCESRSLFFRVLLPILARISHRGP